MESQKKGFDFDQGPPKLLISTAHLKIINGLLHLNLTSGKHSSTFLFPLNIAKQIAKAMRQQVEEIEKKQGVKFDDRLPNEPMPSPLAFDIHKSKDKEGDQKDQDEDNTKKDKA